MKKQSKKLTALLLVIALLLTVAATGLTSVSASADESSVVSADGGTPVSGNNKIYFEVNSALWRNFKDITVYIYEHNGDALFPYGSKKGIMTNEGNNIWSYDFDAKGFAIEEGIQYGLIFTADWGNTTHDIIFDSSVMGDTAYLTGSVMENAVDSNKIAYEAAWKNADRSKYGPVKYITSIGNIIGSVYWADTTPYQMLVNFIKSDGKDGLANALNYNGKTAQQTLDDTAMALGLSSDDIEKAIFESGKAGQIDWRDPNSSGSGNSSSSSSSAWSSLFSFAMKPDGTLELTNCNGKIDAIPSAYPENIHYSVTNPFATSSEVIDYKNTPITSIGDWAFANNKYIETVEIPDSITKIGKGAFYNCVKLQSITLPEGVTELSANTFEKCLYLEDVTLGNQLTSIGDEAFYDCRRLSSLDIPDSVTSIGEEAFTNCRSLKSLTIPDGVGSLGSEDSVGFGIFENCKSLSEINIPASVCYMQANTFDGCSALTIRGEEDSYAQNFALEHKMLFKAITEPDCLVGDISGDGAVDVTDATLVQMLAAELFAPTAIQLLAADTNGDGTVDVSDATLIQMYAAEVITHF